MHGPWRPAVPQVGDLPAPEVPRDTALIIQALAVDSALERRRCQSQQWVQFSKIQGTSGATIYCAKYCNHLTRWSNPGSPEWFFHYNFHTNTEVATDTLYPVQSKTANICINWNTHPKPASVVVFRVLGTFWTAGEKHYFCQTLMQFMKRNHFPSLLIALRSTTKPGSTSWPSSKGSPPQGPQFPLLMHYATLLPGTQDAVRKVATRKENPSV